MTCEELFNSVIAALIDDDPSKQQAMLEHVDRCPKCRILLEKIQTDNKRISAIKPDRDVTKVMEQLDKSYELEPRSIFSPFVIGTILAAAVLLIVVSFHFLNPESGQEAEVELSPISTVPSGMTPLRVVDIVKKRQKFQAILQDFRELRVASFAAGDSFTNYSVEAVYPQEVELVDSKGKNIILRPDTNSEQWRVFLQDLREKYQKRIESQSMTDKDFENMVKLAYQGEDQMLNLLKAVSADEQHYYQAKVARSLSGGNQSLSRVQRLISIAKDINSGRRYTALQALGSIDSPLANEYLRQALENTDDPLLSEVVKLVAIKKDLIALKELQKLANNPNLLPGARNAVKTVIQELSQGESK
ncbi:hypothetical protein ACFL54_02300 [Planctomycetota bacterium]